jgi:phosphatidylserine/phosphatidylglycerophosphate/cardiolipin synthase-like enzyme
MPDWFLPAAAPGAADAWCFDIADSREIRVHTTYQGYYSRLADLIAQSREGDEVFLVGWGFDLSVELTKGKSALLFLEAARGRKARVRLLATKSHSWSDNVAVMEQARGKKLEAIIDDHLHPASGNTVHLHHQKAVYIKLGQSSHLFVGGMDVTTNRVNQWFDVQAEIIGSGAELGRKSLEERWESLNPPLGGQRFTARSIMLAERNKAHGVQFLRTYPPFPLERRDWKRNFAPGGDHTYYGLVSRAIGASRKLIYIEDQFFWSTLTPPKRSHAVGGSTPRLRSDLPDFPDKLESLLVNAIGRGVKVIVIGPHEDHFAPTKSNRKVVARALQHQRSPPTLLQVRSDMMFVHSKVWIFDDEVVVVGSGNVWHKSFVSVVEPAEAELAVAFTSSASGKLLGYEGVSFARALRIRLWERIKQTLDTNYSFPRDATSDLSAEIQELMAPVAGSSAFLPM